MSTYIHSFHISRLVATCLETEMLHNFLEIFLPWIHIATENSCYHYDNLDYIYSYLPLTLLLTFLVRLYIINKWLRMWHVHEETNGRIGALARLYTETNGGIGETLLHSRLSLLSIDIGFQLYRRAVSLRTV